MGNIGSHTGQRGRVGQIDRVNQLGISRVNSKSEGHAQIKVLPDLESKQKLRHTDNGLILNSGGTLRNINFKSFPQENKYSFKKTSKLIDLEQNKSSDQQLKMCKSEPDLRFSVDVNQEKKLKKKYRAPPPPINVADVMLVNRGSGWDENCSRRRRLFKTRLETKKQSSHFGSFECDSDILEDRIQASENSQTRSFSELNLTHSNEFKKELQVVTNCLRATKSNETMSSPLPGQNCTRGEPSGKESSTPEPSPILEGKERKKLRVFYFGMEKEDSDSSCCGAADEYDEGSTIALRLRPVLPRKLTEIPRFSPAAAWKQLDTRSQDSGISGDTRLNLPFSWTPQQDLGEESSSDEPLRERSESDRTQRTHVFSLSLPRDHQQTAFFALNSYRNSGVSRKLRRSVSGALNGSSIKNEPENSKKEDSNWFFTISAPHSLNEHIQDLPDGFFPYSSSTSRLMYLPEARKASVGDKYSLMSKSCEELRIPESLCDSQNILEKTRSQFETPKKTKKFTFQSTVKQIERRRIAEKLSKEAEKKEKQRLGELEAMRRVEEEFQKKRAKEKANIRHQLRLYAMDDEEHCASLPFDINMQRLEPEGAVSSTTSSSQLHTTVQEDPKNYRNMPNGKLAAQMTQELSEYRQMQRDYKEYRVQVKSSGQKLKYNKLTTVYPEVSCNMPTAKGPKLKSGNYRKDFALGMKSTKSIDSNRSEDSRKINSPKICSDKYYPITRF